MKAVRHGISRLIAVGSFADEIVAGALAAGAVAADARVGGVTVESVGDDRDAAVRLVAEGLAPGDVVFDVGANIGMFSAGV